MALVLGGDSAAVFLIAGGNNCDELAKEIKEEPSGVITSYSEPTKHKAPTAGTWGLYRFTYENAEALGWEGDKGLLRDLDEWFEQCRPDSIDDIQAVWGQSGSGSRNYIASIYCKAGTGRLPKAQSQHIPWKFPQPLYQHGQPLPIHDENLLLQSHLAKASFRVIGTYLGVNPPNMLFLITAGS
jgi:hypothetical protein